MSDSISTCYDSVVFFLEKPESLKRLSCQLEQFGYKSFISTNFEEVLEFHEGSPPAALVTDMGLFERDPGVMQKISELRERYSLSLFFISDSGDFSTRLCAIRAGGDYFFTIPLDLTELIDTLDRVTGKKEHSPYRVLVVDDEEKMALYHSLVLQKSGMETLIITNPEKIFSSLVEFRPDLILMDMYMPMCTGVELARLIRQMKAYHSIPIVYLSAERDLNKQLEAMKTGGDDFLTKPVEPEHLVSSVTTRAKRMRTLRMLMERDSMTGLLNHRRLKEELDIVVSRYGREEKEFSFVMIDLDHFKSVNDRFGHASGDTVIVSLTRLLQQRLRKSDIVGRYGGEEFGIILYNTDGHTAKDIIDSIREGFSRIIFSKEETDFTVTFSAGIASFPVYQNTGSLISHADNALYRAKKLGRNRVILAQAGEY